MHLAKTRMHEAFTLPVGRCHFKVRVEDFLRAKMGMSEGATIQQNSAAQYFKWHLFQVFEASQEDGVAVKNGRVEMVGLLGSIVAGLK